VEAVIVGNTAMHHLLLGLPTRQLARAPFVPALAGDIDLKAREIGLQLAPGAYLHVPPNIAGYVGGDHVAVLVATAPDWTGRTVLVLDDILDEGQALDSFILELFQNSGRDTRLGQQGPRVFINPPDAEPLAAYDAVLYLKPGAAQ
jgi:hypothetical protein